jgi:hypothetical protein
MILIGLEFVQVAAVNTLRRRVSYLAKRALLIRPCFELGAKAAAPAKKPTPIRSV